MTVTFQREKYDACIDDARAMLVQHWQEVAEEQDLLTLNFDEDVYRRLEAKDRLIIVTARKDGKLIGYVVIFVVNHAHYKHVLFASEDIHFIAPEHRRGMLGLRLIQMGEQEAEKAGCQVSTLHTKYKTDRGRFYKALGYRELDVVWIKRLGRGKKWASQQS